MIDTLRADRLGIYGHHRNTSPAIDSIAKKGIVFEHTVAPAPWTQPSIASMMCSNYPEVHKVLDFRLAQNMRGGKAKRMAVFSSSFKTLPEMLQENGYETAGFVSNFMVSSYYGFSQGFDHYLDMYNSKRKTTILPGGQLNQDAIDWLIQRQGSKPLFFYMHYMDVHGPYFARPEFYTPFFDEVKNMSDKRLLTFEEKRKLGYLAGGQAGPIIKENIQLAQYKEFWPAFYDAGVRELDFHIQELKSALKKMKLWNDSYIIITADHGEELLEHGYWNHGKTLYETELHVPLIMKCPGLLPSRKRIKPTVRLIDLMPTLAEQLNMPKPQQIQGTSLSSIINGKQGNDIPAFSEGVKESPLERSLSIGGWKLIVKPNRSNQELYNIADDPLEQKDLFTSSPSIAQRLTKLLEDQVAENTQLSKQTKLEQVTTTPEDYERLKSLGYIE